MDKLDMNNPMSAFVGVDFDCEFRLEGTDDNTEWVLDQLIKSPYDDLNKYKGLDAWAKANDVPIYNSDMEVVTL